MTKGYIADLIVAEARKWLEVREHGYNKGTEVEMFQRAVDGVAEGEPWCMCFVQYVAGAVCKTLSAALVRPLWASESCLDVWNHTHPGYRVPSGGRGCIAIWRHGSSGAGHTGICQDQGRMFFHTVEGNTNDAGSSEGDGVYEKTRYMSGAFTMQLVGFIDLPQMILDCVPDIDRIAK